MLATLNQSVDRGPLKFIVHDSIEWLHLRTYTLVGDCPEIQDEFGLIRGGCPCCFGNYFAKLQEERANNKVPYPYLNMSADCCCATATKRTADAHSTLQARIIHYKNPKNYGNKKKANQIESYYQMHGDVNVQLFYLHPLIPYGEPSALVFVDNLHVVLLGIIPKLIDMSFAYILQEVDNWYDGMCYDHCGDVVFQLSCEQDVKSLLEQRLSQISGMTWKKDGLQLHPYQKGWYL